ncbi:hypothetical protein PGTUg99_011403 [Puccinia graminis f. sp. tritici]|uniref:Uncharacterized protein n=1 Tax=Puccinia graminis f. sp. tritici TaxID=56615 RepID=A0A5B0RKQ3_PUCGR|nr:hypothetical protein PGTUg99_011403 [Puccinia graminis f. sp. tritici]
MPHPGTLSSLILESLRLDPSKAPGEGTFSINTALKDGRIRLSYLNPKPLKFNPLQLPRRDFRGSSGNVQAKAAVWTCARGNLEETPAETTISKARDIFICLTVALARVPATAPATAANPTALATPAMSNIKEYDHSRLSLMVPFTK